MAEVDVEVVGDSRLIRLRGPLDLETAEATGAEIAATVRPGSGVVALDLSDVDYCDSAGVRLIFQLRRTLLAEGIDLRVVVPFASPVRRLFDVVRLPEIVGVFESATEALATARRGRGP